MLWKVKFVMIRSPQFRGDVIYCPEDDVHFPTLTVEQTLSFAIKTCTPHVRFTDQSRGQFNREVVEILLRIFGLHHETLLLAMRQFVVCQEALSCRALIGAWDK
jgi:ATP-binding cassette subfamily G (WHITE) protein 2 (SNQ2)